MTETFNEIAIRYNDKSVLENYHIASSYALTKQKKWDIFDGMEREQRKAIR